MEISTILTIAFGIISGASLALKYIAPLTENKVDNKIYRFLVKVLRVMSQDSDYAKAGKVKVDE